WLQKGAIVPRTRDSRCSGDSAASRAGDRQESLRSLFVTFTALVVGHFSGTEKLCEAPTLPDGDQLLSNHGFWLQEALSFT
ncbi:hypothetical protein, partial [Thiocystis violacea]|uniref:hypothetical protein n=1 Tax=Thiocystis violacea TaxID=13725 RepID=UPI001A9293EA